MNNKCLKCGCDVSGWKGNVIEYECGCGFSYAGQMNYETKEEKDMIWFGAAYMLAGMGWQIVPLGCLFVLDGELV